MVMGGDLVGEPTIQRTDAVLQNCVPETCILLLTSVTPINAIKRRQKIRSFILLYYYHNDIAVKLYLQMQRKKKAT